MWLTDIWVPEERRQQGLLTRFLVEAERFCNRCGYGFCVREIVGLYMLHACVRRGFMPSAAPTIATCTPAQYKLIEDPDLLEKGIQQMSKLIKERRTKEAESVWQSVIWRGVSIRMSMRPGT